MTATHLRVVQALQDADAVPFAKLGIVGDGKTYETTGIANLTNALATYETVQLEGRPQMLLGETWTLSNLANKKLTSGVIPNVERRDSWPGFLWDGPKGAPMLSLDRCRRVEIDGFGFATDDFQRVKAPAGTAIICDGGPDLTPGPYGSACTFRNLRHVTYNGPLDVEATFLAISLATKDNQEFHRIINCAGNGNGRGAFLHQGPSANAKNTRLEGSPYIDYYRRGVFIENGSVKLEHNNINFCDWDLWVHAASGFIREIGHIGEHSKHHMMMNAPYIGFDNTFDPEDCEPRSAYVEDPFYPVGDDNYHGAHANAWILIGPNAPIVKISECWLEMVPTPDCRVFGFGFDSSRRRVELGPFKRSDRHTLRTLGLSDADLLGTEASGGFYPPVGHLLFHDRAYGWNNGMPNTPQDLFCGDLEVGGFGVRHIGIPNEKGIPSDKQIGEPTHIRIADGAASWDDIPNGTMIIYQTPAQRRFQHVAHDGTRSQGIVGQATPVKP